MRDLLPQDMARFRRIEDVFRESCTLYGYQEVRSPTLEYLHCFTSTGTLTPQMLRSTYSFLDWDGWSGERVVLRPDGTIPIARLFVDNFPQEGGIRKFFYVENVFRFTESGQEARERWQCGAEFLGSDQPQANVELITLSWQVLDKLGFHPVRVEMSHAGILRALLGEMGLGPQEQGEIFDEIQEGDVQALTLAERERPRLGQFLPLLLEPRGQDSSFLKNLKVVLAGEFPSLAPAFDNFIQIAELLSHLERPYEINFALPGGFEYYTGVMFHLYVEGARVGGGGRYDELIPLVGGAAIPSSGFALYVDRLMGLLKAGGPERQRFLLVAQEANPAQMKAWFELASLLRARGWVAEISPGLGVSPEASWIVRASGKGEQLHYVAENPASGQTIRVPMGEPERLVRDLEAAG